MAMTELDTQALGILTQAGLPIDDATCCLGHALEAIKIALTQAPSGWKVVPIVPPYEMNDAGRSAVMARDCSGPGWGAGDHYKAAGLSTEGIDPRLLTGKGVMSKAHCADLVWQAMLAAAPEYKGVG